MSAIQLKAGEQSYTGSITTIQKDREYCYFIDLGDSLQFSIALDEEGLWKSDNPQVDPIIVKAAGDFIENMEDFGDVISALDILKN